MPKNPTRAELLRQGAALEATIEASANTFQPELNRAVNNYLIRVQAILNQTYADELPSFANAIAVGEQISDALLEAGFEDLAVDMLDTLDDMRDRAIADFGTAFAVADTLQGFDVADLDALAAFRTEKFLNLADERLVAPIRDAVTNTVVGGASERAALDQVQGAISAALNKGEPIVTRAGIEFTDHQLETLVSDSFRRHYRQTKASVATDLGLRIISFDGPLDKITSDQCEFMMLRGRHGAPNLWLESEFTADLHPAMRESPLVAGGHFNCRHTVDYVTYEYAKSLGWTGPKVGSVEDL